MTSKNLWTIRRNIVSDWTKHLPKATRHLILWLDDHARKNHIGLAEIARMLTKPGGTSYSKNSVYQFMNGKREEGQLGNFLAAIESLQKSERQNNLITDIGFIETTLTERCFKIADATRNFGKIGYIIGRSHLGKTTIANEIHARSAPETSVVVRVPVGGAESRFLKRLASALEIKHRGLTNGEISDRIIDSLHSGILLIVDEFHQCFRSRRGIATIEAIREIHDLSGAPVLLFTTPDFDEALEDAYLAKIVHQTDQRHLIKFRMPEKPTVKDRNDFARHFGLPIAKGEAKEIQNNTIADHSLGRWLSILAGASRMATASGQDLTWGHVIKSHDALLSLQTAEE